MKSQFTALACAICLVLTGCSGGSGSRAIPNPNGGDNSQPQPTTPVNPTPSTPVNPTTPVTPPTEQLTLLDNSLMSDLASEVKSKVFNVKWDPRALAIHGNVLYIANAGAEAQILRYDFSTKTVLAAIDSKKYKLSQDWDTINDIYIKGDRLYVPSHSTNRVDIFDLSQDQPKFIMSLGTGYWWGDQNYAMVHSHAVAANDQYVFSVDIENRINVWKQSDVTADKHLKAQKFARLSLPNCGRYCTVRLETVGDLLYAGLSNGETYVYDTTKITQSNDIAPTTMQNGLASNYHLAQDGLLYAKRANGSIASFKPAQVTLKNLLPNAVDTINNYRLSSESNYTHLSQAQDFTIYNHYIIALVNQKIVNIPLRRLKQQQSKQLGTPLQLNQKQALSESRMLQNGEKWETLTNKNERHVFANKILSAQLENDGLSVQSYSAIPVTNLELHAKLKNSNQWVVLAKIDRLNAFSKTKFKLDIDATTRLNLVDGTGSVQLQGIDKFKQLPVDLFEFKIESKTDTHVQKLNTITAKWNLHFGSYDEPGKWCRITPLYAREWIMMMTNMAYMLSSPEFEKVWFDFKNVMGYDFYGNSGQVQGPGGFFTEQEYKDAYHRILNRGNVRLGVTNMGGGLGGEEVLGVDTWLFYGHYRLSGYRIIAHEFGHAFGGHHTSWASVYEGFEAIVDELNYYFQRRPGSLPYMDPNVNAFHLASDSEVCQGINQNMVNGVATNAPWNRVDKYFEKNPMPTK